MSPTESATAAPGQRPDAETHFDSLQVGSTQPLLPEIQSITIVDDVVTRGATLLACFTRLQAVYPQIAINCFALIRTVIAGDVDAVLQILEGEISYRAGQIHRYP